MKRFFHKLTLPFRRKKDVVESAERIRRATQRISLALEEPKLNPERGYRIRPRVVIER